MTEKNQKAAAQKTLPLVLLAEDNYINAVTLIRSLKMHDYEVIHASTGTKACEMAEKKRPSLIIMDIQLPEMDGLTAIQKIRALPDLETTPIIALTAAAFPGDKERCLEAGANVYLSKPARFETLLEHLNTLAKEG